MNPDRLKGILAAAAKREHGSRARYMAGCRCLPCRAANSRYESGRLVHRATGDWNGIVDATKARRHLHRLGRQGVGYKAVAARTGLSASILWGIRQGTRPRLRARTERLILAVNRSFAAGGALVPAGPTWRLIDKLITDGGFSKAEIARRMGKKSPALQFRKDRVLASTARKVEDFYRYYLVEDR